MPLPPEDSPIGEPIAPRITRALMDATLRLPSTLEAQLEGQEGPIEIPPEQWAEAFRNMLLIVAQELPNLAGRLDLVYHAVAELEKKVYGADSPE